MPIYRFPDITTNELIDRTLINLEPLVPKSVVLKITSGVRTPGDQLMIIAKYALVKGIIFPEFEAGDVNSKVIIEGKLLYKWQRTWSQLLNIGIIINPPLAAEVLFDYIKNGKNKKGQIIQPSPHFTGRAFDIGGSSGINKVIPILIEAVKQGIIKDYLVERANNCLHVNLFQVI